MPNTEPAIHVFRSSGDAYDCCQWNEEINTGDILVVPTEGNVIALAGTWPTRIVGGNGASSFHEFKDDTYRQQFADEFPESFQLAANLHMNAGINGHVKRTVHPSYEV